MCLVSACAILYYPAVLEEQRDQLEPEAYVACYAMSSKVLCL